MFNKQLRAEKSVATKEERLVKNRERYNTHRSNNLDKVREIERIKKSTRLERDALYKLKVYTGTSICNALSKNGYKKTSTTATILGCTFDEFYSYIEQQFVDGMSWDNRGEWDLDHIIPVSFGKTEEEIIKLNHYSNFRPLWKSDNLSKAAKITEDALNHPIYLEIIMWRFKK